MDKTIKLLRDLTEASGVSGYETPVTRITKEYLIHSLSSIMHRDDYDKTVLLLKSIIQKLDLQQLEQLTTF